MSKVTTERVWSDFIELQPRYRRSVHLERDIADRQWLSGYVVTPLGRATIQRIVDGILSPDGTRAWSLTGPYGSGKSAFALFLSHALSPSSDRLRQVARRLVSEADDELARRIFKPRGRTRPTVGLVPVLATGQRQPLEGTLVNALAAACANYWRGSARKPSILADIAAVQRRIAEGKRVATSAVVKLFEETARKVAASSRPGNGLLVVLDEAGKALEFAAQHEGGGDIQILQELAEAANRSADIPLVFVVVLHQAFDQYADQLTQRQRNEWAKVQGRFADIPFREEADQLLRLIGGAIKRKKQIPARCERGARRLCRTAAERLRITTATDKSEIEKLLCR
ncbi:MAG: hypothetical protein D6815_12690, partial [Candidatus Dadabacteria bacterium]